ncbi:hypothetical protein BaRGS_00023267, partial [Batillaria attramentaria]
MSAEVDLIGHQARSREGRGLSVRSGDSDKWITIQKNTFMNWVNLQLQGSGHVVDDFEQDFDDGVKLCALVESLQNRKIGKVIKKPINQHQSLENVTLALKAIAEDNVRLVNIGGKRSKDGAVLSESISACSEDIVNGSLKLILGLVWHLILRYQIGKTKFPPKKLMLAWLQAVIPECHIGNFTSDWNDGVALSALIDYCEPGLFPEWKKLSRHNRLENCQNAMTIAREKLNIPMVVRPEDFSSPHLDDLSGMTYLSYYMMPDSPGYYATRREIRKILQSGTIDNFTTDWNDGRLLCTLVKSVGGDIPGWPNLSNNPVENLQKGLDAAQRQLSIEPIFSAQEMADPEVEHLGVMAYAAYFTKLRPVKLSMVSATFDGNMDNAYVGKDNEKETVQNVALVQAAVTRSEISVETERAETPPAETPREDDTGEVETEAVEVEKEVEETVVVEDETDQETLTAVAMFDAQVNKIAEERSPTVEASLDGDFQHVMCRQEKSFKIQLEDGSPSDIRATLKGPDSNPPVHLEWQGKTAYCSFTPVETGQHTLDVTSDGKSISGCPVSFRVVADRSRVTYYPVERCAVGALTELKVDASNAGQGDLRMEARSPSGHTMYPDPIYRQGRYTSNFTPNEVGTWEISVLYDGDHISGSPYTVQVFDPLAVRVYGLDGGAVGRALTFNADATQAGDGDMKVKVTYAGSQVPSHVIPEGNGEYKIDFTPQGPGQYTVNVFMNDVEVRGSPYTLDIVDSSQVTLSGAGLSLVPVDRPTTFTIHTKGAGSGNVTVDIAGPRGKKVPVKLREINKETVEVEYTPVEAGDHKINVRFFGQLVKGSPYVSKAYNTGKLIVSDMPQWTLPGNPVSFHIDASKAGSGNIEIRVNGGRVACSVENRGNHCFLASFVPEGNQTHTVDMTFNDQEVEGSPWKVHIIDPQVIRILGGGKDMVQTHRPATFTISCGSAPTEHIAIDIKDPDDNNVPYELTSDSAGDLQVTYTPRVVGDHTINVQYSGQAVAGSPFTAKAYNAGAIIVTPLADGFVGQPLSFDIDVREAGEGQLQIMVNNGNIANEVDPKETGVYAIQFVPLEPGQQKVDILFNDEPLPLSPLTCNCQALEASVIGLSEMVAVDRATAFTVQSQAMSSVGSEVIVLCPNGQKVAPKLTGHGSPNLTVEYVPREVGTYVVSVNLAGTPIKGSPFRVKTFDPSKVKVSRIPEGIVGVPSKFTVDASAAGEGTMEIAVSANGRNIPNQAHSIGSGSPFKVEFLDASQMSASGDGLGLIPCHRHTDFLVHTPAANLKDLTVDITGPDGRNVPARMRDMGNGSYKVDWTPSAVGNHRVQIEYAGVPIGGSPYSVQVFDASLVRVSNISQGFLGKPVTFSLDASDAGDGNLEIHVTADGESVPNYVRQERDANFRVTFTPQRPSRHKVNITFNGEPVPGSPFSCVVMDTDSVSLTGDGLRMAPANTKTSFKVDPKGAGDFDLRAWVVSPSGHDVPVRITGNPHSAFRVDYTPVDVGTHKVYVEYGGMEVRGSPFDVEVFDPALVRVNSPGRAYLNKPIYFYLDSSMAGQGKLEAEIKSRGAVIPSQLREVGGGRSEMTFTPRDVNTHQVNLTFQWNATASSSVSISGEGLHSAKVYRETWFSLDLHGMDAHDLDVSVTGPAGQRVPCGLSRKGHICRVEFTPMEPGPHTIDVMFAGSRIHGSPFTCEAYDPSRVRITDVDRTGKKEREIGFTIDTSAAGVGDLEAIVTHHGHIVHTQRESLGDGRFRYAFFPPDTGHYEVKATYNEDLIPGCPLIINVEDDLPTFITISFRSVEPMNIRGNRKNYFMLHTDGNKIDTELLDVNIEAPTGETLPSHLVQQTDGDYRVEWTPKDTGRHSVDVLFAGQRVKGSPFYIEVFDVSKIRVDNFYNGNVGEQAGFTVDTSRAGKCEQSVRVVSPSGRNMPVDVKETPNHGYNVSYIPTESGQHRIFLAYNSLELP